MHLCHRRQFSVGRLLSASLSHIALFAKAGKRPLSLFRVSSRVSVPQHADSMAITCIGLHGFSTRMCVSRPVVRLGDGSHLAAAQRRLMLTTMSGYWGQDRRFVMIFRGYLVLFDAMVHGAPPQARFHHKSRGTPRGSPPTGTPSKIPLLTTPVNPISK